MPWKNGNPPLYSVWRGMLHRCYNPKCKQYYDYGGRGIRVCEEWRTNFKQFSTDMLPTYKKGLSLDRIDNNLHYCKNNCKWSTHKEQQRNQRATRKVLIGGKTYIAADLADISGLKTDTIVKRASQGLSYSDIISTEKQRNLNGLALGAAVSSEIRRSRTHCKHGHEYTPDNTYWITKDQYSWRSCRTCHRIKVSKQHAKKKANY